MKDLRVISESFESNWVTDLRVISVKDLRVIGDIFESNWVTDLRVIG